MDPLLSISEKHEKIVSVSKHEHRLTPLIIVCRYYEYANDNVGNAAARLT